MSKSRADNKPQAPETPFEHWRMRAYGDERDDMRAVLSAGSDTTDDLLVLEYALAAAVNEEEPIDPETRQRALQAVIRMLHERSTLLHCAFDYLWNQKLA